VRGRRPSPLDDSGADVSNRRAECSRGCPLTDAKVGRPADVAELVDARRSGRRGGSPVEVRVLSSASSESSKSKPSPCLRGHGRPGVRPSSARINQRAQSTATSRATQTWAIRCGRGDPDGPPARRASAIRRSRGLRLTGACARASGSRRRRRAPRMGDARCRAARTTRCCPAPAMASRGCGSGADARSPQWFGSPVGCSSYAAYAASIWTARWRANRAASVSSRSAASVGPARRPRALDSSCSSTAVVLTLTRAMPRLAT